MMIPPFVTDLNSLTRLLPDARVESLPANYVLVFSASQASIPIEDPRHRWRFSRTAALLVPRQRRQGNGLYRVLSLYFDPEDRERVERTGRLMARLLRLHEERFGFIAQFPRGNEEASIWLTEREPYLTGGTRLGGETWNNHLYLYGTQSDVSPLEWIRRIVHEWGHLTLPAARGYREPEGDAGGFLGERLFLKWLYAEETAKPSEKRPDDGVFGSDVRLYYQKQIAPLLKRFAEGGPNSPKMEGVRTENMDYYIASALAFDEAVGSAMTGKALFAINGVAPKDLLAAMLYAVARTEAVTVRLPAWVPLPKTRYRLSVEKAGSLAIANRPPLQLVPGKPLELALQTAGWKWIRTVSGSIETLRLERISPVD